MKNIVHWVIDKDIFDYTDNLVTAVTKCGMQAHVFDELKEISFSSFIYKTFKNNEIVILHGSLQQGEVMSKLAYYPGVYLNLENYECSRYYGYYGSDLLNSNYIMMGMNDVVRNYNKIFENFQSDKIFIRPSNGYKSFPGQLLPLNNFEFEFNVLKKSYSGLDTNELVVVAPYKEILKEWRFIIVDNEVIAGSLYMDEESRKNNIPIFNKPCILNEPAAIFAKYLVNSYSPDNAYTIDVCETRDRFHLLEINSFCCANMYGANYDDVVRAINNIAIRDYNDIN